MCRDVNEQDLVAELKEMWVIVSELQDRAEGINTLWGAILKLDKKVEALKSEVHENNDRIYDLDGDLYPAIQDLEGIKDQLRILERS